MISSTRSIDRCGRRGRLPMPSAKRHVSGYIHHSSSRRTQTSTISGKKATMPRIFLCIVSVWLLVRAGSYRVGMMWTHLAFVSFFPFPLLSRSPIRLTFTLWLKRYCLSDNCIKHLLSKGSLGDSSIFFLLCLCIIRGHFEEHLVGGSGISRGLSASVNFVPSCMRVGMHIGTA